MCLKQMKIDTRLMQQHFPQNAASFCEETIYPLLTVCYSGLRQYQHEAFFLIGTCEDAFPHVFQNK